MVKIKRYIGIVLAFLGAILVYMCSRRGDTIKDLKDQILHNQIETELKQIAEQSKKSDLDYEIARKRYADLRAQHPSHFKSGPQG